MSKQKYIDDRLYNIILEIWENSESYSKQDIQEFLVEQGYLCDKLKDELIEMDKCPKCFNDLIVKTVGYQPTDAYGYSEKEPINIRTCKDNSCGFTIY